MDTVFAQADLERAFDQVVRQVTEQIGGISLTPGGRPPRGKVCTVTAIFESGFHSSLALCAETSVFVRITQHMMESQQVSPLDVEDFTKEYFNVLCGHLAALLFRPTRIASRFGVPSFYQGAFHPEGYRAQFALAYSSDLRENVQIAHLVASGE
ncbi:MAG: chemotaxis protein CheX [Oscillibacter sp.]|nr:chemotaxis protein CheX [Oscillibacter sp.]